MSGLSVTGGVASPPPSAPLCCGCRVLVCAPSEAAADVIAKRIAEALAGPLVGAAALHPGEPLRAMLRVCSPSRLNLAFQSFSLLRHSVVDESGRSVAVGLKVCGGRGARTHPLRPRLVRF